MNISGNELKFNRDNGGADSIPKVLEKLLK
jgi:hypothetical protein